MKKFLSLILAVLMLASMAVSASAVKILKEDGTFAESSPLHFCPTNSDDSLLDYFTFNKLPYGGAFYYKGEILYTWWYDSCPDCDGLSFQFVKDGAIKYECLEKDCGKSGVLKAPEPVEPEEKPEYTGKACTECGSKNTIFLETVSNAIGFIRDEHFCLNCEKKFYTSIGYSDDCIGNSIICSSCFRYAYFDRYFVDGPDLYARYECRNGHVIYEKVNSYIDFNKYNVYVYCTAGGEYTVEGGSGAYYGQEKTIKFYPANGYYLADVLVDGERVAVTDNTVNVTVKNNTVVRAYFDKLYFAKNYTIETEVNGNGTVTAQKNFRNVAADEITAYYTDKVVYTFVPASKNYYVADVVVNGRSFGSIPSYAVTKIQDDTDIEVTFAWKNPYVDVNKKYEAAVEYVTEAGIMEKGAVAGGKVYFNGGVKAAVRAYVDALVELADVADILDNTADRIEWAISKGIIDKDTDISAICDVQTACAITHAYLEVLEDLNDIEFKDFTDEDSAKDTAIKIKMVNEKIYDNNRDLTRYDIAAVMYLIAGLEYND